MSVIMYYDDTCTLCVTTAMHIQAQNPTEIRIISVDMGLAELNKAGITRTQAMTYICVQDEFGKIHKGMQAIQLLCAVADAPQKAGFKISRLLRAPVIKQICTLGYPIIARNRYYFPTWAIRLLYGNVADIHHCNNGVCHIPPHKRG